MSFFASIVDFFNQGGFVMPPLVVGTMLLWYALGYRFSILKRGNRRSVRVLVERYRKGYDRSPSGIIDDAIVTGLTLEKIHGHKLSDILDETFAAYERKTGKFKTLVNSIVIVAPLAGLLGTVSGMMETFDALGDMSLFSQSGGIAGGISEALFSTQMGLAVAVPGRIVGRILDRKQEVIENELQQIKNMLTSGGCV